MLMGNRVPTRIAILGAALSIFAGLLQPATSSADGCCVCTTCPAPDLFACRDQVSLEQCQAACEQLGCSGPEFSQDAACIDLPQCFGDCCDGLDGTCSQRPEASCAEGGLYLRGSTCDGSSCIPRPPTRTPTMTATATPSRPASPTSTPSATAAASATATPTAQTTPTVPATATATATSANAPTATETGSPPPTSTGTPPTATPSAEATATPTLGTDSFVWIVDRFDFTAKLTGIPPAGVNYLEQPAMPSLQLQDGLDRFCTEAGLEPRLHLDLPAEDCADECNVGIFAPTSASRVSVARLPALRRSAGTFDLLVETRTACETDAPLTTLRFPDAIAYVDCGGDCDADGIVRVNEVIRGVRASLGLQSLAQCPANDGSGDGAVQPSEILLAIDNALGGCSPPP